MRFDCGRVAVGGDRAAPAGDAVETRRSRSSGSTALTMMPATPAATRSSISALLDGGGRLLGIFELQVVVRQFALRLLDAGLGDLPEVGGAVDDERQLLLVGRRGRRDRQHQRRRQARNDNTFHSVIPPICVQTTAAPAAAETDSQKPTMKAVPRKGAPRSVRPPGRSSVIVIADIIIRRKSIVIRNRAAMQLPLTDNRSAPLPLISVIQFSHATSQKDSQAGTFWALLCSMPAKPMGMVGRPPKVPWEAASRLARHRSRQRRAEQGRMGEIGRFRCRVCPRPGSVPRFCRYSFPGRPRERRGA